MAHRRNRSLCGASRCPPTACRSTSAVPSFGGAELSAALPALLGATATTPFVDDAGDRRILAWRPLLPTRGSADRVEAASPLLSNASPAIVRRRRRRSRELQYGGSRTGAVRSRLAHRTADPCPTGRVSSVRRDGGWAAPDEGDANPVEQLRTDPRRTLTLATHFRRPVSGCGAGTLARPATS